MNADDVYGLGDWMDDCDPPHDWSHDECWANIIETLRAVAPLFDHCPDGVDMADWVQRLIALWDAVHGEDFEGDGSYPHTDAFLERLRKVGRQP